MTAKSTMEWYPPEELNQMRETAEGLMTRNHPVVCCFTCTDENCDTHHFRQRTEGRVWSEGKWYSRRVFICSHCDQKWTCSAIRRQKPAAFIRNSNQNMDAESAGNANQSTNVEPIRDSPNKAPVAHIFDISNQTLNAVPAGHDFNNVLLPPVFTRPFSSRIRRARFNNTAHECDTTESAPTIITPAPENDTFSPITESPNPLENPVLLSAFRAITDEISRKYQMEGQKRLKHIEALQDVIEQQSDRLKRVEDENKLYRSEQDWLRIQNERIDNDRDWLSEEMRNLRKQLREKDMLLERMAKIISKGNEWFNELNQRFASQIAPSKPNDKEDTSLSWDDVASAYEAAASESKYIWK